jgi:CubicO group peptidase (beta-lactamase class C family)
MGACPQGAPVNGGPVRKKVASALITCLALSLAGPATTRAQTAAQPTKSASVIEPAKLAERLDHCIDPYVRSSDFSGIVLIAQGTRVLVRKTYGLADFSAKIPLVPGIAFRIASLSKTFTAGAVEMLVERGRLGLTDHLSKFLPGFINGDKITVRDLLLHRSGVGVLSELGLRQDCHTAAELVARLRAVPPLFEPGTSDQYSNEGYLLLARIIEIVSGVSYGAFLDANIFRPLGMHRTSVECRPAGRGHPLGYYSGGPGGSVIQVPFDEAAWDGPGSLVSNADDLHLWLQALAADRLMRFHALEYPYGWGRRNYSGRELIEQSGELEGFVSTMSLYAGSEGLCFVVLSNVESGFFNRIPAIMEAVLFGGSPPAPPVFPEKPAEASALGDYAGAYKCPQIPVPVSIDLKDGKLWMHWGEDPFLKPLTFGGADTAFLRAQYATIRFSRDKEGRVTGSSWDWGGPPLEFKKIAGTQY